MRTRKEDEGEGEGEVHSSVECSRCFRQLALALERCIVAALSSRSVGDVG